LKEYAKKSVNFILHIVIGEKDTEYWNKKFGEAITECLSWFSIMEWHNKRKKEYKGIVENEKIWLRLIEEKMKK
jgi:hypothetical protein